MTEADELETRERKAHDLIAAHLEGQVAREEYIQTVEYDPEIPRWYVRFGCDGRDATTIYFDLHQRTLRYEVYFLPDPPANHLELYRYLLRRNHTMYGARFSIGPDGDLYLVGRVALEHLSVTELDRIIGVIYETVETWFQPVNEILSTAVTVDEGVVLRVTVTRKGSSKLVLLLKQKADTIAQLIGETNLKRPTTIWLTGAYIDGGTIAKPQMLSIPEMDQPATQLPAGLSLSGPRM